MEPYKKMYTLLFNAITDALKHIDEVNYGLAAMELRKAQIGAEAIFVASEPKQKPSKFERKFFGCGFH